MGSGSGSGSGRGVLSLFGDGYFLAEEYIFFVSGAFLYGQLFKILFHNLQIFVPPGV